MIGNNMAARIAMIAMTTSSSMSVNARHLRFIFLSYSLLLAGNADPANPAQSPQPSQDFATFCRLLAFRGAIQARTSPSHILAIPWNSL
jgi:hypothetical protein